MHKPIIAGWFILAGLFLCAYTASASLTDGLNKNKLMHAEKIIEPYQQGQEFVKVTVNLNRPWDILEKMDWHSAKSLSILRNEIYGRQQQVLQTLSDNEALLRHRYKNLTSFSAEVSLAGLQKLSNDLRVESIEPVFQVEQHVAQGIDLMNALATRSTYNGQGIAIAVCDTGIDYNHPALGGGGFPNEKVIGGYDFGDNDPDPVPNGNAAHGTACAGIAAGDVLFDGDYIGGVAYGAKLYALKISAGDSGSASSDDMVAAWDWCVTHQNDDLNNPIMVISTSFGGGRYFSSCDNALPSMTTAANNAVAADITLLVSSGNDGYCDSISWPACISSVISVGAVYDASFGTYQPCISEDSCATKFFTATGCSPYSTYYASDSTAADKVTSYSNTVSFLDILAPSNRAYTIDISGASGYSSGDYYSSFGGTSAACPYAAGAVAILQSASKAITEDFFTPDEIRTLLISTGDDVADEKVPSIIKPRVNVANAMGFFIESPPVASDSSEVTQLDTSVTITLNATDDGLPDPPAAMTYIITSLPSHGQLSDPGGGAIAGVPYSLVGYGDQVIYTPDASFVGSDSFQFKANDGDTAPNHGDSNTATVSIDVMAVPQIVYSANMDINPGWTYEGDWEWGVPTGSGGTDYGNPDPTSGYTGSNVVGFNLNGDYSKRIRSTEWATTPAMDCSGMVNVTLSFYRWLNVEQPLYDHAYIQCSNNGSTWTTIWENPTEITDNSWVPQTFDISAIADGQSTVYLRWGMGTTDGWYQYSGWNIDDVEVAGNLVLPQHTLTISSTSGGSVSIPGEGAYSYNDGMVVNITAIPELHYHFVGWTGTGVDANSVADPNAAATTITMDNDYAVMANFAIDTFTLNYTAGAGGTLVGETLQVVDYGGDGTEVTALPDTGYHFVKWSDDVMTASRTDTNVTANISVIAIFAINPIIISGFITEPDPNYPVANVFIASDGEPNVVTDANGFYEIVVDYGWSGTLTPSKTGYTFEPNSITYTNVTTDPNDGYIATLDTFNIFGYVFDSNTFDPLTGVLVSPAGDGGPFTSKYYGGADITDANGFYEVLVDYGFSGDVVPSKYAYAFEPNGLFYTDVTADIVADQNYIGTLLTYTITGTIDNPCELPIEGVLVEASNGGGLDITDPNGFYEVWVDYNWSGTVTPSKQHYTFDPNVFTYMNVLGDQMSQDYIATNIYDLNCDGSIELGDLAILCQNWLATSQNISGDLYKDEDNIVNLLDFAAFADVWGD